MDIPMKILGATLSLMTLSNVAIADVVRCDLNPTGDTGFVTGQLRVYHHEDIVHSAFVEAKTDYGDDLPYVFLCEANCTMSPVGDDYKYSLRFSGDPRQPDQVVLLTESRTDNFSAQDVFAVGKCSDG